MGRERIVLQPHFVFGRFTRPTPRSRRARLLLPGGRRRAASPMFSPSLKFLAIDSVLRALRRGHACRANSVAAKGGARVGRARVGELRRRHHHAPAIAPDPLPEPESRARRHPPRAALSAGIPLGRPVGMKSKAAPFQARYRWTSRLQPSDRFEADVAERTDVVRDITIFSAIA